jgi:hypothetical protein
MALITETNAQYYSGMQYFDNTGQTSLTCTLNTILNDAGTAAPNYTLQANTVTTPTVYQDLTLGGYSVSNNIVSISASLPPALIPNFRIVLSQNSLWDNYGSYEYIKLNDIIDNFLVAYVGNGKLISSAKRTDVMFHAKRGLQEFSYDTLKSVKSTELTISPGLTAVIPQDYVNYVQLSWVDQTGVKHIIYPTTLTSNPTNVPVQDAEGLPTQDEWGQNIQGTSITDERWRENNTDNLNGVLNAQAYNANVYNWTWWEAAYGQRYGADTEVANMNGWFTIDERKGKFAFSSDLKDQMILLEYISDGLASDLDTKVPKMAEEAMYLHIAYNILAGRANVPEYIVRRYKVDRRAALRNAKIRLSNIKLDQFIQVMRGKSKWIKH